MANTASGLSADQLLAGPRGRRFLLEFAQASERTSSPDCGATLYSEVSDASYRIAKLEGQAVFRFGWGPRHADPEAIPETRPEDVAALLAEVALAEPTPELLRTCLAHCVDSAMYWQRPDGYDLLAALPVVQKALTRVADHIASSAAAGWLGAASATDDQWRLRWLEAEQRAREPRAVLTRWAAARMAREQQFRVHRRTSPTDEVFGLWWSRPPRDLPTTCGTLPDATPSGLVFVEDSLGWSAADARRAVCPGAGRRFQIDGPEDWAELCRAHPLDVTATMRDNWGQTTERYGGWVMPDWARVAQHYDAVRLSYAGYLSAAGTPIPVDDEAASVIAGWDPDATYWLIDIEEAGDPVPWRRRGRPEEQDWAGEPR